MFKTLPDAGTATVTVVINGAPFQAPQGCTAAAALLLTDALPTRTTPVSNAPRAPYCMMGVCFECLVAIDGVPNQQGCLIELTRGGREPITVKGERRTFLLDGDTVALTGTAPGAAGGRISLGEVHGRIRPGSRVEDG